MPRGRIAIKGGSWGGRGSSGNGNSSGNSSGSGSGSGSRSKQSSDEGHHTSENGVHGGRPNRIFSDVPWSAREESQVSQPHACYVDLQGFVDCINMNANDISVCQERFDAFMACKEAPKKAKPLSGFWEYILP